MAIQIALYTLMILYMLSVKKHTNYRKEITANSTRIEDRATNNVFTFSKSKTQCIHFCHLRKKHDHPDLYLSIIYGSQIPVVEEVKFLGIIFDRTLSFLPHIKYLKS